MRYYNSAATLVSAGVWDGAVARRSTGTTTPHRGVSSNLQRAPSIPV